VLAYAFGYTDISAILLATIFVSSSIAIVVPSMESSGLVATHLGKGILSSTIIDDIVSLVILSLVLQTVDPTANLPLPLFYLLLVFILIALRFIIPRVRKFFFIIREKGTDIFEFDVRATLVILLGVVVLFQLLGLHAIIAGFFAGLVLSDSIQSEQFTEKIRSISYGFFIPVFFIVVGATVNLGLIFESTAVAVLTITLILGSSCAKFLGGFIAARVVGFDGVESTLFGVATLPQLSTTLAVTFTAFELGLIDDKLVSALVVLSLVTSFFGPLAIDALSRYLRKVGADDEPLRV
jgi:CPA2 family monovalent cation:H+ antiporter-2